MKILFVIFHGFDPNNGISKKIAYQLDAFKANGHEAHICYLDESDGKKRIVDGTPIAKYGNGVLSKIKKRIEFGSVVDYAQKNNIDFVYIRSNHNANHFTIKMIKGLKKLGIKVVMEIPTYPYDQEYGNWWFRRQILQDKLFRYQLAKQLDAIVTFSDDDYIFGQHTIRISNAISFEHVHLKKNINDTTKELNLIGVAEIHNWHGFDRIIRGLAHYYSTPKEYHVHFHIVGYFFSATIEDEVKSLIHLCNVGDYVTLHGKKHGKDLDEVFEKCDFGIGSLGRHRVGIKNMKSLKNREYAARGLAFTYSEIDEDFDNMPYVLKMPADDSAINIQEIIDFYEQLSISPQDIRNSISHLSWKNQMKRVLDEVYPIKNYNAIKIVYCIPSLDRPSGMERVLTTKANYLVEKLGYDVSIILTDNKGANPYFPLSNKVKIIQLDVNIDSLWKFSIWKRIYLYNKKSRDYKRKLEDCLNRLKPDITISLLRREINFINDIKDGSIKMGEIHFGKYRYREIHFKYLPKFINAWISNRWMVQLESKIKRLNRFIVLTHEDAKQWTNKENTIVISNPITIESEETASCDKKRAIVVGRYTYQKGLDLLLETWKIVEAKHPDWSLHIYGAGNREAFEHEVKKNNLSGSIICHNATHDIVKEYLNSSIYIFSSRYEGFGLVLAEAMSIGLPCVSFACPCGPRDIIHDGEDGILCENGNIQQLADGICKLIENEELRKEMGRKASINIQRYSLDNIMRQWDQLFKEVIRERDEKNLLHS